ncbi:hypothetical protein NQ314_014908 [Rhamnusium bicolor]|uniref:Uncharacterized protein n=1 Tax=Rhamnusium bicolor TaxID=1586634 RepID=A0AAV8X0R4_9CUCU|nr:hypothetical protein NQ314_014908 [Rhamnusium bicolor]
MIGHPISREDKEKLFRYHKECVEKTGVDEKLVDESQLGQYPEEPEFKEYTFCLSKRLGLQNEAGEFQMEAVKAQLSKHIQDSAEVDKLIETCVVQKDSPIESAYNTFKCYHDSSSHVDMFYVSIFCNRQL